jgi:hypothetical protein
LHKQGTESFCISICTQNGTNCCCTKWSHLGQSAGLTLLFCRTWSNLEEATAWAPHRPLLVSKRCLLLRCSFSLCHPSGLLFLWSQVILDSSRCIWCPSLAFNKGPSSLFRLFWFFFLSILALLNSLSPTEFKLQYCLFGCSQKGLCL